jgi:protein-ribulosamine 3-kinase
MPDWSAIKEQLKDAGIATTGAAAPTPVSGGDISAAWRLPAGDGDLFIKTGPLSAAGMFGAEADGLAAIAASETIRVPAVISTGQTDAAAYLALEWLRLERSDETAERRLGERLAAMHRTTASHFGWHRDNTIGLTPQHNPVGDDWVAFYREQRLAFQLRLAAESGFTGELQEQGARLMKRLPIYFEDRPPSASLLHGDLWGGNWASCGGQPVVFDPAVYYGDRETDLAMTRLFGGFGPAFYDAYESTWPLPDGHYERRLLYQLYHVLNHLNLFGSAYLGQAMQLIDELR